MQIEIDRAEMDDILNTLDGIKGGAVKVLVRSLNKTMNYANSQAAKAAALQLNMAQKNIKLNFKVSKAFQTQSPTKASWQSKGKPVPLIQFTGTRQTSTGVSVQVRKDRPRKIIPHTFIATMKSGHQGVFWRMWHDYMGAGASKFKPGQKVAWGKMGGGYRLKISEREGPRIEDILKDLVGETVSGELTKAVEVRLMENLKHEAEYLLSLQQPPGDGSDEDIL